MAGDGSMTFRWKKGLVLGHIPEAFTRRSTLSPRADALRSAFRLRPSGRWPCYWWSADFAYTGPHAHLYRNAHIRPSIPAPMDQPHWPHDKAGPYWLHFPKLMRAAERRDIRLSQYSGTLYALNEPDVNIYGVGGGGVAAIEKLVAHTEMTVTAYAIELANWTNYLPRAKWIAPHWSQLVMLRPWVLRQFWWAFDGMRGRRENVIGLGLHLYEAAEERGRQAAELIDEFYSIQPSWLRSRDLYVTECSGSVDWCNSILAHRRVREACYYWPGGRDEPDQAFDDRGRLTQIARNWRNAG